MCRNESKTCIARAGTDGIDRPPRILTGSASADGPQCPLGDAWTHVSTSDSERTAATRDAEDTVVDMAHSRNIVRDPLGPHTYAPTTGRAGKRDLAISDRHRDAERRRGQADVLDECRTDLSLHELVGERSPS